MILETKTAHLGVKKWLEILDTGRWVAELHTFPVLKIMKILKILDYGSIKKLCFKILEVENPK